MSKQPEAQRQPRQVRIEIDDAVADGTYANLAFISSNNSEFILDFARFLPGNTRGKVISRVIFGPIQAKAFLKSLDESERQIARIEKKLNELNETDSRVQRLQTIPGVGPRTAEALVAVIDDPHRFRRANQLGSYLGMVPKQFESGQMSRQGRITKQGNAMLRTLLVEASWVALRYNPRLRAIYRRITAGGKSRRKIAIVAVARRMLVIAWAMMRDGTEWRAETGALRA